MNLLLATILPAQQAPAVGFCIQRRNLLDAHGNNFTMWETSHAHVWYPNKTNSFARVDRSNTIEPGDYSFDPTQKSFTDWDHMTSYRNGVVVRGIER